MSWISSGTGTSPRKTVSLPTIICFTSGLAFATCTTFADFGGICIRVPVQPGAQRHIQAPSPRPKPEWCQGRPQQCRYEYFWYAAPPAPNQTLSGPCVGYSFFSGVSPAYETARRQIRQSARYKGAIFVTGWLVPAHRPKAITAARQSRPPGACAQPALTGLADGNLGGLPADLRLERHLYRPKTCGIIPLDCDILLQYGTRWAVLCRE